MRCPNCGTDVEGSSPFCPNCGADLTSKVRSRRRLLRNVDRGIRHGTAAVITLVAVASVLIVIISATSGSGDPGGDPAGFEPPEGSVYTGEGYVVLEGDFAGGDLNAHMNSDGYLVMSIPDELAEGYDTFYWNFRDESSGTSYPVTKTRLQYPYTAWQLEWIEPEFGRWSVTVTCSSDDAEAVYRGTITYYGDLEAQFTWNHQGRTLMVTYTITAEEYLTSAYAHSAWDRTGVTLQDASSFVDPASVADLEERIWSAYSSTFTFARTSSDYATCILGFVSSVIETRDDVVSYGYSVYWTHPLETLYGGYGDTGDKAVLAASLLGCAGFDAGIASLPDGWAVALAGCIPASSLDDGYAILEVPSGGTSYHVCSVDDFRGIGVMSDRYGYDDGLTYYGVPVSGYGLVALTAQEST